jgi:hypothetical protein
MEGDCLLYRWVVPHVSLGSSAAGRLIDVGVRSMTTTLERVSPRRPDSRHAVNCAHHLADDPDALVCSLPSGHAHGCVFVGMTLDDSKHADRATQEDM